MSLIRPFSALLPDGAWFRFLLGADRLGQLKSLLEPRNEQVTASNKLSKYRDALDTMLHAGNYHLSPKPAMYIYERETATGAQFGIWVQTSLDDLDEVIVTHENTLSEHLQRHLSYRKQVGLEGSPILLTYPRNEEVNQLAEKVVVRKADAEFYFSNYKHRIWSVSDVRLIEEFQLAFSKINRVYVADGHHRLAAAAELNKYDPQWITSLYISTGQLICREFNKMILSDRKFKDGELLEALGNHFYISEIPGNIAYRPCRAGRMGLLYLGKWYQMDMKSQDVATDSCPDVSFLQNKVLEPIFGIDDPRTDKRLSNWPANDWEDMLLEAKENADAILFTLYPISADSLISLAETGFELPPKSTYTEPKVPYGMLLCDGMRNDLALENVGGSADGSEYSK